MEVPENNNKGVVAIENVRFTNDVHVIPFQDGEIYIENQNPVFGSDAKREEVKKSIESSLFDAFLRAIEYLQSVK